MAISADDQQDGPLRPTEILCYTNTYGASHDVLVRDQPLVGNDRTALRSLRDDRRRTPVRERSRQRRRACDLAQRARRRRRRLVGQRPGAVQLRRADDRRPGQARSRRAFRREFRDLRSRPVHRDVVLRAACGRGRSAVARHVPVGDTRRAAVVPRRGGTRPRRRRDGHALRRRCAPAAGLRAARDDGRTFRADGHRRLPRLGHGLAARHVDDLPLGVRRHRAGLRLADLVDGTCFAPGRPGGRLDADRPGAGHGLPLPTGRHQRLRYDRRRRPDRPHGSPCRAARDHVGV